MVKKGKTGWNIEVLLEEYPFLKQILQNIHQVIWVRDPDTDAILYVSPAFESVWGRSCASLYIDPASLIKSVHPEDRVKVLSASSDDPRRSLPQSYRIVRPDGSLRWISAHTFLVDEETSHTARQETRRQETRYQIWVAQDVTDQNQIDQTLRKALDRSREQFTL